MFLADGRSVGKVGEPSLVCSGVRDVAWDVRSGVRSAAETGEGVDVGDGVDGKRRFEEDLRTGGDGVLRPSIGLHVGRLYFSAIAPNEKDLDLGLDDGLGVLGSLSGLLLISGNLLSARMLERRHSLVNQLPYLGR
jgi:hypothetical protein